MSIISSPTYSIYYDFVNADTEDDFDAYIAKCKELAIYDTGVNAEYGDKLITLSTCEYSHNNGRMVVLLSMAQGKVIIDDNRETHRCEMRDARHLDAFCYEDDLFEQFHNEAFLDFVDPFELREAEEIAERKELQRLREIEKVRIVLSMMKPAQERRLYKFVIEGKSCREIAVEEGTYHSSVSKSIEAAKKNFKKFYENL